jgi:heme oxygenase
MNTNNGKKKKKPSPPPRKRSKSPKTRVEEHALIKETISKENYRDMYDRLAADNKDLEARIKEKKRELKKLAAPDRKMDVKQTILELEKRGGPWKEFDLEKFKLQEPNKIDVEKGLKVEIDRADHITKQGVTI